MKTKRWWTVQFVPHGKGHVQSYTFKSTLLLILLSALVLVIILSIGASCYFYLSNLNMNKQLQELQEYKGENLQLQSHIQQLETELLDLHDEVLFMQEWLKEVELLEQEVKEMDSSSSLPVEKADAVIPLQVDIAETYKSPTVAIASIRSPLASRSSDVPRTIKETKNKLEQIKIEAELQQQKLIVLKEKKEEEQYLAQFIPSIAPSNGRVSSLFGWRKDPFHGKRRLHQGIDFVDSFKSPIYATAKGKVIAAERSGGYGNQVVIDHGNGYVTTYSHLTSFAVSKGDQVEKGDIIGRMGSTGRSTGVHLHYEIHKNGQPVNPLKYVRGGK